MQTQSSISAPQSVSLPICLVLEIDLTGNLEMDSLQSLFTELELKLCWDELSSSSLIKVAILASKRLSVCTPLSSSINLTAHPIPPAIPGKNLDFSSYCSVSWLFSQKKPALFVLASRYSQGKSLYGVKNISVPPSKSASISLATNLSCALVALGTFSCN